MFDGEARLGRRLLGQCLVQLGVAKRNVRQEGIEGRPAREHGRDGLFDFGRESGRGHPDVAIVFHNFLRILLYRRFQKFHVGGITQSRASVLEIVEGIVNFHGVRVEVSQDLS